MKVYLVKENDEEDFCLIAYHLYYTTVDGGKKLSLKIKNSTFWTIVLKQHGKMNYKKVCNRELLHHSNLTWLTRGQVVRKVW